MFGDLFGDLQKRTGRYLLQRYLGQFLDGKLSLQQLEINLLNGRGTVNDVSLCCKSVNELCEEQGWGVEVTGGHIGQVTVTVPWNALLIDDSSIEVTNLQISLKPKPRETDGASMLESMWSSVSSSMQLAKECLENEGNGADVNQLNAQNPIEGLEKFAQTIENILKRVKAKFLNTEIRLEHIPPNSNKGIAIIIKIDYLNYQNEACNDMAEDQEGDDQDDNLYSADEGTESPADRNNKSRGQKTHYISSHSTHHITIEGITISTEEFNMEKKKRKGSIPVTADDEHETLSVSSANTSSGIDNTSATSLISSTQFYSVIMTDLPNEKKDQNSFSSGLEDNDDDEVTVEDDDDEETEHEDEDNDQEDNNRMVSNQSIPVVRIDGTQEVRIKVKEIDNISGPKVSLDLQIGAVFIFLSPRQIHLLTHFYDVYFNDTPAAPSHHYQMPPVEAEEKVLIGGVGVGGWSDPLENFVTRTDPYGSHRPATQQRQRSYCESLSDSITSTSTTTTTNSSRFHRKAANLDMNGDISSFNVRVASVCSIVLHEEVLFESSGRRLQPPLTEESVSNLLDISNYFFSCIEGSSVNNFKCEKNHLRAQVKPIIAEGIQQRNNNNIYMKFKIFLTKCDLYEHLSGGRSIVPIVMFDRGENMAGGFLKRPEITLLFKSSTPATIYSSSSRRKTTQPKTEFRILLETCTVELDISIYDRLSAIFSTSPFPQSVQPGCIPVNNKYPQPLVELKVEAPIFNINLRFPIADCRPLHDPNRVPWWKQNIRPDFLQIVFYQFRLSVISTVIEILGNELDFFYCESESSPKIHIGKSNLVNCASGSGAVIQEDVDYPKITLEFPTNKKLEISIQCIQEGSDSGETSGDGCDLYKHKSKISLPFCSKRVCRESDTPHVKRGMDETETVLLPGDKAELNKFCDRTMKTSKVQIKLHLPVVSVQIHSKHLYETIYNRLNTDLLMWEPSSPIAQSNLKTQNPIPSDQSLYNIGMMDSMYVPPMNSTQIDNDIFGGHLRDDENSGQSDCGSDSLYNSTYERKRSRKSQKEPANTINSSLCSFELTVSKGMLDFSTPVRDSENRVLPGQYGEFIIMAENLKLFSVNGFNGNENLAYLCVQAKSVEVYHCGLLPFKEESNRTLRSFDSPIPHFMKSTLYSTPKDLTKGELVNENAKREMLSLVIEIKKNLDQRIKRIKLTVGIQKTALRYHPTLSQHSWLTQIIDFVDVVDYPIEGYKPFGIITEMQLHLWDCAIDYRPKFLSYRAVLEIGSLLLSSNIISSVTGCTLRFVPEECVLSLAPYDIIKRQQNDNVVSALPSKDLIPVIDIGLFDISLRINDKATESFPKLDLRASIHDIHIRTCSDSGRALAQLISYFASDGDCGGVGDKSDIGDEDSSMTTSHTSSIYCEADLLSMKECATSNPEISPEQQERVNQMVADAVQETVRSPSASDDLNEIRYDEKGGVELFYFPDETHQFPADKKNRDVSPSSMSTSPSRTNTPHKLQHRTTSDEWGFRARRESESSNELRDLLNFEENVMKRSYMVDSEDNIAFGDDDDVVEALPQIREELGEIHSQKVRFHSDLDEDYCVIGDEERIAMSQCGIKDVKLSEDPLRIVDNHFTPPLGKPDLLKAPDNFPMAVMRYTLCEMTVVWHLYGGHDFDDADSEKDKENVKPKAHMSEAYKHGVSFSKNQNAVTFGKKPMEKVSWKTKGGKSRNHDILIEIQLTKVKFSHEEYPTTTTQASRQVLIVSEMEIRDRLQSSEINKFLHHPTGNFLPNKSSKHMVVIKALHVRPSPQRNQTQECSLRVSLLPMRINIDQDTLLFFVQFFSELTETGNSDFAEKRSSSTSSLQAPIMMVDDLPESIQDLQARKLVNKNIDLLMDDETSTSASVVFAPKEDKKDEDKADDSMSSISSNVSDSSPIYFKEVVFSPEVLIRLDYVGRRIEMSRGPIAGLLMGLGQLQCSEIRLKQICHRHGILGFDKLFNFLFKEWLADIKKNQLPAILRGVGPTYTIVQLLQGIKDLFWLPIEQYQKDGRIVRGLQLGAQSFTARTAFAALEITSRIIQLLQLTAETAFDMVSPGPSSVRCRRKKNSKKKRLHRPQDIRQGFGNAYLIVKDGINERVNTVIENTIVEHDQKGYTGAAGAIIRQIPPMALAPVVLATQATTNILGGVKNQLVPDAKYEAREKWKDDSD